MSGFWFHMDGVPYSFGCGSVAANPTATDTEISSASIFVPSSFEPPVELSEQASPITGELTVSSAVFKLFDVRPSSGDAAGLPVATWLSSRSIGSLAQTKLTSSLSKVATTVNVVSTASFPTAPFTVWIGREALRATAKTSTTLTVTRSYLNTRAVAHEVTSQSTPTVYAALPSLARRRVQLRRVDEDGLGRLLWIGYVTRAPRLSSDGGHWELQCESAWTTERSIMLGPPASICSLRGFDTSAIQLSMQSTNGSDGTMIGSVAAASITYPIFDDLATALAYVQENFNASSTAIGPAASQPGQLYVDMSGVSFSIIYVNPFTGAFRLGSRESFIASTSAVSGNVARGRMEGVPSCIVIAPTAAAVYPITNTYGFPAVWPTPLEDASDGAVYGVKVESSLTGEYDDEQSVEIRNISAYASDPATVTGTLEMYPSDGSAIAAPMRAQIAGCRILERRTPMRQTLRIEGTHWLSALRRGVLAGTAEFETGVDYRNWEWTGYARALSLTGGTAAGVLWRLDGSTSLRDLTSDACKLRGVAIGVREGRLSPFALQPPLPTDSVAATFTQGDYVVGKPPKYALAEDLLRNSVTLKATNIEVTVNDETSAHDHGQTRSEEIDLHGTSPVAETQLVPSELRNVLLRRFFGLYAQPVYAVTLTVRLEYAWTISLGDYVTFSDARLPNGSGDRGALARTVQVIGRRLSINGAGNGFVELQCLHYDRTGMVGYSPCVRIASIAGAVLTIAVDYIEGPGTPSDYAGSDAVGYTGTANDGGVSKFAAGYKIELFQRDATSPASPGSFTVLSVDPVAKTITLTASAVATWKALVDGGALVDARFDGYGTASLHAEQKDYAWIAAYATSLLNGVDSAKTWSP